ncbi:MAG: type II and III secretion system protein family protein [Xanthobacteraceae bacterium]|nr:type II and III secretion system protein family protein [Xanthobacteraceae bacterium]
MINDDGRHAAGHRLLHTGWTGTHNRGTASAARARRLLTTIAAAAVVTSAWLVSPFTVDMASAQRLLQISGASRTATVLVPVGKTEDLRIDTPFTDITVGDPDVADVAPLTDRAISVLGKKVGTTRVTVYAEGRRHVGIFDIEVTYEVSRLAAEVAKVAGRGIRVSSVNGRIMLSGEAPDAVTLDRAVTIARQFAPEIINTVTVASPQQVMLEVRFVEASRQAGRELGVQWNVFNSRMSANIGSRLPANRLPITAPSSPTSIPVGEVAAGVLSGASPFGFMLGRMIAGGTTIDVLINALEQKGLVRTLAEPNLVALSGDTASFLAGGEIPIPVGQGTNNQITVEWKRYGVGLAFTPTVLNGGLINLKIEPEVSQLDPNNQIPLGAGLPPIPAMIVRRAATTIELRDGQSFMIGGLLQNEAKANVEQVPWLASLPVLGQLFASRSYLKKETDLAIIVTPRLVKPVRPGSVMATPLDNTLPANDADFFLTGNAELTKRDQSKLIGFGIPFAGHILDLPKGATNVVAVRN